MGQLLTPRVYSFHPIVTSIENRGRLMANRCVVFFTNNRALVDIINKQTAKKRRVLHSKHVLGILNLECNLLLRLQVEEFRHLASRVDNKPTLAPPHLLPKNGELVEHLKLLLQSAISPGSRRTYQQAWTVHTKFAKQ